MKGLRVRRGSIAVLPLSRLACRRQAGNRALPQHWSTHGHEGYCVNAFNRRNLGKNEVTSVRPSLQLTPTPALTLLRRGDYAKVRDTPRAAKGGRIIATGTAAAKVAAELGLSGPNYIAQATAIDNSYGGGDPDDGDRDVQPFDDARITGGSLPADLELSQPVVLRSITGYCHFNRRGSMYLDGTQFQVRAFPDMQARYSQFSQESQKLNISVYKKNLTDKRFFRSSTTSEPRWVSTKMPITMHRAPLETKCKGRSEVRSCSLGVGRAIRKMGA